MDVGLTVLIVDDDEVDREQVRRLLPREHEVCEAASIAEAHACLGSHDVSLTLLDYRLPDADGVELLPTLRERHIPVIMLTGVESPEVIVNAMQLGAQDYLVKGALTEDGLRRAIANALEKAALVRAVAEQQRALAQQAAALEAKNREIRALALALTLAEQEERRRVAYILHDDLQQQLYGANFALGLLRSAERLEDVRPSADRVSAILKGALETARNLAVELTPPVLEQEDLEAAFTWLASHVSDLHGLHLEVVVESPCHVPSRGLRVLLLQLARELVFNVIKRAGVNEARIRLGEHDGCYTIAVEDDGRGFDVANAPALSRETAPTGLGLYSVRERLELLGGRLDIESREGEGTRATIWAPVEATEADPATLTRA